MAENKKNMPMEIIVDDGSQRVSIKNSHGDEIGVFYFHPTDVGIVARYNGMAEEFEKIVEPIANIDIGADGTANETDEAQVAALAEAEKRLYKAVNYSFGGNMAEAFFGSMHPFSPVNGAFYCELALEAVGNYISAAFEQETAKYSKRIGKYTNKYAKK